MSPPLRPATPADAPALAALQEAAYAPNRALLGAEPLPLLVDSLVVIDSYEVWLAEDGAGLAGALILDAAAADFLIWSIATRPDLQKSGLGRAMLAKAEARARDCGHDAIVLYTGEPLTGNIAWYQRHGFAIEHVEVRPGRRIVHMRKSLA
jgi:GNAT superfamily N-acetyltransferase